MFDSRIQELFLKLISLLSEMPPLRLISTLHLPPQHFNKM